MSNKRWANHFCYMGGIQSSVIDSYNLSKVMTYSTAVHKFELELMTNPPCLAFTAEPWGFVMRNFAKTDHVIILAPLYLTVWKELSLDMAVARLNHTNPNTYAAHTITLLWFIALVRRQGHQEIECIIPLLGFRYVMNSMDWCNRDVNLARWVKHWSYISFALTCWIKIHQLIIMMTFHLNAIGFLLRFGS